MGVLHGFEAWPNSKGGILQVGQNYDLCELGGMFGTLFPKSNQPIVLFPFPIENVRSIDLTLGTSVFL